uniref:Uncharacterized protein n=1 Tax=Romanomermis culicivorax TaxID=13658 RepID=A0A915KTT1_ROMCU
MAPIDNFDHNSTDNQSPLVSEKVGSEENDDNPITAAHWEAGPEFSKEEAPAEENEPEEEEVIVNEEPLEEAQKEWSNETGSEDPIDLDESRFSTGAMSSTTRASTIATVDHETTISDLEDTGGCPPLSGQCLNAGGTIVWNATQFNAYCLIELIGHYIGHSMRDHIIIKAVQEAFKIIQPITMCNLQHAYLTKQGPVL